MDLCPYAEPHKSPAASQAARKAPNWNRSFITWFLLPLPAWTQLGRTWQLGKRVKFRDHVVILKHRQIPDHAKIRFRRNLDVAWMAWLTTDGFVVTRGHRRQPDRHDHQRRNRKSEPRRRHPVPEAAARGFRGNARAQRCVKRRRGRNRREIVERAPERAELLGARAAGSAAGQVFLDGMALGRPGAPIKVFD